VETVSTKRGRQERGGRTESGNNNSETLEHDSVLDGLLLESVDDAVDELNLQSLVNVSGTERRNDLRDNLHAHLAVRFALVLEVVDDPTDDLGHAGLVGEFDSRLDDLAVVPAVEGHATDEEVLEELGEDLVADVLGLDTVGRGALLDDLEDDLLHLLVRGLELAVGEKE
jgi:hypothetical protein